MYLKTCFKISQIKYYYIKYLEIQKYMRGCKIVVRGGHRYRQWSGVGVCVKTVIPINCLLSISIIKSDFLGIDGKSDEWTHYGSDVV